MLPTVYLLVVKPCPTTIRGGTADTCKVALRSAAHELLEEQAVLLQVPVTEELVDHAPTGVLRQLRGLSAVPQERLDSGTERR
jgi:hypothetical protein